MDKGNGDAVDRDLLERYLLGRVTPEERLLVEEMLRSDETWRIALLEEQRIAAAVRRTGRDAMKARLRSRVGGTKRFTIRPRVLAAAAVIATVIGIGVLFRWPVGGPGTPPETPSIASDMDRESDRARVTEKKDTPEEQPKAETAPRAVTVPPPAVDGYATPPPDALSKSARQEAPTAPTVAGTGERERADDGKALREDQAAAPEAAARDESGGTGDVAWVTATVTASGADARGKSANALGAQSGASEESTRKAEQQGKGKPPAVAAEPIVTQMPAASLPLQQQSLQAAIRRGQLQARLSRRAGTMEITLYPEEPFSGEALARARVTRIGADSIVVAIDGQQVGMKVPGDFGGK